jgi:arginase
MNVDVVLAPYDSGRYAERMGRGPAHLSQAIAPMLAASGHEARVQEIRSPDAFTAEIRNAFVVAGMVAERVRASMAEGRFPLVLSGNCNTAVGTVSGCGCERTGVLWFDAHGEATTPETTRSGFLDGMPISVLTGQCWRTMARSVGGFAPIPGERIVLVGARDLEPAEEELLARVGVRRSLAGFDGWGEGLYAHFDLDVLDPSAAVWNRWATAGGMTVEAVKEAVEEAARRAPIRAAGFASYDPETDADGRGVRAAAEILSATLAAAARGRD